MDDAGALHAGKNNSCTQIGNVVRHADVQEPIELRRSAASPGTATRAAVEEGVVAGGGVPLARASLILSKLKGDNDDQRFGIEIVRKAVQTPLRQIAENAGEDGAVISGKILDRDEYNWGFDAQSGEFKDLVKAGIVDPTKVVRTALQDAASVAGLLVTTEAMVAEKPEKKAPAMPGGGGMGDMDY